MVLLTKHKNEESVKGNNPEYMLLKIYWWFI